MLSLFGNKNVYLGIDIGTSAIKVVEIKFSGDRPTLTNYGWVLLEGLFEDREVKSPAFDNVLTEYLKKITKNAKFKGSGCFASIPAFGGLITLIEFPEMSEEDLNQAIKFEAHKYIPTSLESVVFSWDIVGRSNVSKIINRNGVSIPKNSNNSLENEEGKGKYQVLLVAASKNKVAKYERIIKGSGLELKGIEIESFSMVRSLIGNDQGNFIIVDIGSRVCNIALVEKGIIKVNRNIDAGGKDITRSIASSLNISEERAEKLKTSGNDIFSSDLSINYPTLELIVSETSRVIKSFYKEEISKVDAIILSGGTANLFGIADYFMRSLNVKTIVGNPFSRIDYNKKLEPVISLMKTHFSVAVGLALRGEKIAKK